MTTLEDTPYVFGLADFGFGDPSDAPANSFAAVTVTRLPTAGSLLRNGLAVTVGESISAADIAAGLLRFAPVTNANGAGYASLGFRVQDDGGTGNGGVDRDPVERTLTIDVVAVNDAPVAFDVQASTLEDTALMLDLRTHGSDVEGSSLDAAIVAGPTNDTLAANADGTYTYTPNENFNGTDSLSYPGTTVRQPFRGRRVKDGVEALCPPAMPRRARLRIAGMPLHIIQRGNNRGACFFSDHDYACYLHHLGELAGRYACSIHAYVLMTNHVHLLLTSQRPDGVSLLMKHLGQRYVQYVNRVYQRSGTLWEGRYRSSIVQSEIYLLRCQRYIELNPVRAAMVGSPAAYPWSSCAANALGHRSALVVPHPMFVALGEDESGRRAAYRELLRGDLDPLELEEIRMSANAGYALGNERFRKEIAAALGRRAGPGTPGRPVKEPKPDVEMQEALFQPGENRRPRFAPPER